MSKELKLRTLKEIMHYSTPTEPVTQGLCFGSELREEAIKHLKDDGLSLWNLDEWIKHFFNITEENLK